MKIGVLGLQGAVQEHVRAIEACGAEAVVVKKPEQLSGLDGLVLPGGESTTMRRLMDRYGLMEPLKQFAADGKPMFGTCAGLILLAKRIVGYDEPHLGLMDITVERNSFGRQRESFEAELSIKGLATGLSASSSVLRTLSRSATGSMSSRHTMTALSRPGKASFLVARSIQS